MSKKDDSIVYGAKRALEFGHLQRLLTALDRLI